MYSTTVESVSSEKPLKKIKFEPEHPFVKAKLTLGADSREVQTLVSQFRACGGRLDQIDNARVPKKQLSVPVQSEAVDQQIVWPDCLDPASHQRLSVLFCSFLHNSNT